MRSVSALRTDIQADYPIVGRPLVRVQAGPFPTRATLSGSNLGISAEARERPIEAPKGSTTLQPAAKAGCSGRVRDTRAEQPAGRDSIVIAIK